MTVKEAARRAGTSVRTLRYYEEVGLIQPDRCPDNDYRDYDDALVARIRLIRAYRELQLSVEQVRGLLDASRETRNALLENHIETLRRRRQQLDNRIALAQVLHMLGPERFGDLDVTTLDAQMTQAQRMLDENPMFKAMSDRFKAQSKEDAEAMSSGLIRHLAEVANAPQSDTDQAILNLIAFIEEYFYPCTDQILKSYARAYGGDGFLAQTMDEIGGPGTAQALRQKLEQHLKSHASS